VPTPPNSPPTSHSASQKQDKPLADFVQETLRGRRGRCLYDGKLFPKTRPSRKFCNDHCRYQYAKFGSASKAQTLIMKSMRAELDAFRKAILKEVDQKIEAVINAQTNLPPRE
jgi:hypothetical protein